VDSSTYLQEATTTVYFYDSVLSMDSDKVSTDSLPPVENLN